ncbi:ankyrin-3-like protein, partial [Favolaschia claudopus]
PSPGIAKRAVIPDLASVNALARTSIAMHQILDPVLFRLCASVEPLGRRAILFTVLNNSEIAVDKLVAAGISLNTSGYRFFEDNCGILHVASAKGKRDMVRKILSMCEAEEMRNKVYARTPVNGLTALDYAARYGHIDVASILIPIQPPADTVFSRRGYLSPPLMEAIKRNHIELCQCLISAGADVNLLSNTLGYSINANNIELLKLLLASGVNPNGEGDRIPLFDAVLSRKFKVTQALVEGGADINIRDSALHNVLTCCSDAILLRYFLERGVDPNAQDSEGRTALHYACWQSAPRAKAFVVLLLMFGAGPVDKVANNGRTAVDAAMNNFRRGETLFKDIVMMFEPLVKDPQLLVRIDQWKKKFGLE